MTKQPDPAASAAPQQRGRPFPKGQSGNPKGRKAGSRNKASLAVEALLEGEAEALTRTAVELALGGDVTALRLCLERLCPPRRDRPLDPSSIKLPTLTPGNLAQAQAAVARALAGGRLTPSEADALGKALEHHRRALEATELETRLARIEAAIEEISNAKS